MTTGLTIFTLAHVAISLIGIVAGLVVTYGFLKAKRHDGWTATFLTSTVLTSVTGFLFPFHGLLASHVVGGFPWLFWGWPSSLAIAASLPERGA